MIRALNKGCFGVDFRKSMPIVWKKFRINWNISIPLWLICLVYKDKKMQFFWLIQFDCCSYIPKWLPNYDDWWKKKLIDICYKIDKIIRNINSKYIWNRLCFFYMIVIVFFFFMCKYSEIEITTTDDFIFFRKFFNEPKNPVISD